MLQQLNIALNFSRRSCKSTSNTGYWPMRKQKISCAALFFQPDRLTRQFFRRNCKNKKCSTRFKTKIRETNTTSFVTLSKSLLLWWISSLRPLQATSCNPGSEKWMSCLVINLVQTVRSSRTGRIHRRRVKSTYPELKRINRARRSVLR